MSIWRVRLNEFFVNNYQDAATIFIAAESGESGQ